LKIALDRKTLAKLALENPEHFKELVEKTKTVLAK
jgi:ribosomal protein L20